MLSPDSKAIACLPSDRNSTHRPTQIPGTDSNLFLRHQFEIAMRRAPARPRLSGFDRALMVWMTRARPELLDLAQVVKPETILRWHRVGFTVTRMFPMPEAHAVSVAGSPPTSIISLTGATDRAGPLGAPIARPRALTPKCHYFCLIFSDGSFSSAGCSFSSCKGAVESGSSPSSSSSSAVALKSGEPGGG